MKKINIILIVLTALCVGVTKVSAEEVEQIEMSYQKVVDFVLPENYASVQGFTITDKYIVVASIKEDATSLIVYDKFTLKEMDFSPISKNNFGHANDMAYNSVTKEIYIVDNKDVYILDADTLEIKETKKISVQAYGIAIDTENSKIYLIDSEKVNIYNLEWNQIGTFKYATDLTKQNISVDNNFLYFTAYESGKVTTHQPVYNGEFEEGTNLIYEYNFNGNLKRTLYIPVGYGELEAMEFDGEIPYLLFNTTDGKGAIYVPKYNTVNEQFSIKDDTKEEKSSATLYSDSKRIETVDLINGKYTFSDISYDKPGEYTYRVEKESKERQKDTITITTKVSYDASTNTLSTETNYDAAGFKEEENPVDNEVIETPTTPNNSANELEPGTVENPQTGSFIPGFIVPVLLGIAIGVVICKRKLFFKL